MGYGRKQNSLALNFLGIDNIGGRNRKLKHRMGSIPGVFSLCGAQCYEKKLIINTLSFEIHMEVYDRHCDMERVDRRFRAERKRNTISMMDFHADGVETAVTLQGGQMAKLLRYRVHTLEIFMWGQDYLLVSGSGDNPGILPEESFGVDGMAENEEILPEEPYWCAHVEYADHTSQNIACYEDYLPERPEELFFSLLGYFEPKDEEFEDYTI